MIRLAQSSASSFPVGYLISPPEKLHPPLPSPPRKLIPGYTPRKNTSQKTPEKINLLENTQK